MKKLKRLSRKALRTVAGGGPFQPGTDTGCSYKCCSNVNPQICSATVTVPVEESGSVSCAEGSHLVAVD
ncbi:bacteriocin-like protein [Chryseobacterium gossypii]|uniref:bacteriocin-like protein n=1 Tax=Chryseobacterium gossypii TaxID=3231602 RepID=UPI003F9B85B6